MAENTLNFEIFAQDANEYVNELAHKLDHPNEKDRVLRIWRAVLHTVRDRIDLGESFQLMAPLPMIFKGIYVQNWKYSEKPPLEYNSLEEMKNEVKNLQDHYGEEEFNWRKPTEEIIADTIGSLRKYLSEAQLEQIIGQMPKEIMEYLLQKV